MDVTAALRERVKELDCLYEITRLSQRHDWTLEEILSGVGGIVARAWQYPEIACVKLTVGGRSFTTPATRRPVAKQSSPVRIHGEIVGHIEVGYCGQRPPCDEGPFLREERHLLDAVADHLGRIIEARENEERLRRLSQELIKAQEHERQRIARELHDDVGQTLSVTRMHLEGLLPLLGCDGRDELQGVREKVQECSTRLGTSIMALRDLAYNLLPPALTQLGLAETAYRLCEELSARHGITITFFADGMEALRLPFETNINLYRVLQEGLANACRHGHCSSITVRLIASHPHCLLHITDDGHGFDPEARLPQALAEKHMGIWSMRQRIRLLGGRFTLRSRPGKGVRIKVEVPTQGQGVCPAP
ncbi:sensor histidine kinase [Solidesulfovibrio fructosivorans]|uniref:sensor histidine kinase n=1 Tax=Solidesulfovibrio fructosivorans TaxID=878 RepID=UPI0003019198|nr:sensor histidine kinase [Solidesulfovibrio fructosivorans]